MTGGTTALRILLVDDEAEFASTLAERLVLRGFWAEVARDGESALVRLAEEPFDVVLLDMMLPGMHGLEVLRRVRETLPDLPIVMLTGRAGARDGIDGMKRGAKAYLSKPVDIQELLDIFSSLKSAE